MCCPPAGANRGISQRGRAPLPWEAGAIEWVHARGVVGIPAEEASHCHKGGANGAGLPERRGQAAHQQTHPFELILCW